MDCLDTFINLVNNVETKKTGNRPRSKNIWCKNTYRLDRMVQDPGNSVWYYLQDGPDRAFVREELVHVSEDTQVPPDYVSEWK